MMFEMTYCSAYHCWFRFAIDGQSVYRLYVDCVISAVRFVEQFDGTAWCTRIATN